MPGAPRERDSLRALSTRTGAAIEMEALVSCEACGLKIGEHYTIFFLNRISYVGVSF